MIILPNEVVFTYSKNFQDSILNEFNFLTKQRQFFSRLRYKENDEIKVQEYKNKVEKIDAEIQKKLGIYASIKIYPAFNWVGHRDGNWFFPTQKDVIAQKTFMEDMESEY